MRRFIVGILILIASVWAGVKIAEDPGLALFLYRDWSVEMPLWFAILCFLIVLMLFYVVIQLFDGFDASIYRFRNWLRWRRKSKSYSKTNRGLLELIEGRWRVAENYLLEGIDQSDAPLINYLAAAKAAHERGAYDKRDLYLRRAHDISPQSELAIGLTQAELQFKQGQLEHALATLNHLRSLSPRHPRVLRLLERVYVRLADWQGLLALIPSLRKAKLLTVDQLDKLELHVYEQLLQAAANKTPGLLPLQLLWQTVPHRLQKKPALMYCYAEQLMLYPHTGSEVESLILRGMKYGYNEHLVKLYGVLEGAQAKKQLAQAEAWLRTYPNQAELLLTTGRLCMRCQLWGKARSYFEESLRVKPSPEAYVEYGKLLEQLGDENRAVQMYRDGLAELSNMTP